MSGATLWRKDAPPQDGTLIVAIGRTIRSGDGRTEVWPFTTVIRWGGECWLDEDGMAVAYLSEDRVFVDWWAPTPEGYQS